VTIDGQNPIALMSLAQVAKYLGVAEQTIHLWAQQGELPAFKAGSVWWFRRSELDKWLERSRSGASVDKPEPLSPYIVPPRSKWRLRKDEEQAEQTLVYECKAFIETTLKTVGREVFLVKQFEDRFSADVVSTAERNEGKTKSITALIKLRIEELTVL
jgi:excisionase family DNA binding protein